MVDQAKVGLEEVKQEAWLGAYKAEQQLEHGATLAGEKIGEAKSAVELRAAKLLEATKGELLAIQ